MNQFCAGGRRRYGVLTNLGVPSRQCQALVMLSISSHGQKRNRKAAANCTHMPVSKRTSYMSRAGTKDKPMVIEQSTENSIRETGACSPIDQDFCLLLVVYAISTFHFTGTRHSLKALARAS